MPRGSILQQVRGVRQNPFQRPVGTGPSASGGAGFSNAFNMGADAPKSFSAPGGWQRALTSLGLIGGTAVGISWFLNRETRDGLAPFESKYLNATFTYLAGGLTLTGAAAYALHRVGFSQRLMFANPWLVLGVGMVASIGGMLGAQALPPNHPMKVPCWLLFNLSQAAVLSPLLFLNPAILARAGLYTAGIVGALSYVGATAKDGQYLYLGGPLLAGVTCVALASLAPMILPATAVRTLAATEAVSLYGGLAVFGGFILWDTQKVLREAKMVSTGMRPYDPLSSSIGLELDFINIFVRIVQILAVRDQQRR